MSKFKQGLKFRHDNTRDTDIMVVTEDAQGLDFVTVTVMYMTQTTGRPIERQQITIQEKDYDSWKQVVEEDI
jgi:hypothetical protein